MAFPMTSQIGDHACMMCGQRQVPGGLLRPSEGDPADKLWMCDDCQRKLARRVDDRGALGG